MTDLVVLCVGRPRDKLISDLAGRQVERLSRFAPIRVVHVPEAEGRGRDPSEARRLEGERLRAALDRIGTGRSGRQRAGGKSAGRVMVVALDERGSPLTSREVAAALTDWQSRGTRVVAFLVGGDEGLDPEVVASADASWSLSRMTFTHEMARLILLEQLFRAHSILAGHPYHRD